jgi:hypothetical protein
MPQPSTTVAAKDAATANDFTNDVCRSRQRPPPQEMPQPRPTEKTAQKTHPEKTGF